MDKGCIEDTLSLEYRGESVRSGRMDSYGVAANIMAFSDFMGVLSKTAYGERVEIQTEIQGFRGSSFDIDFGIRIGGILNLITGPNPTPGDLVSLFKDCISLWRHLEGSAPNEVQRDGNTDGIRIENHSGSVVYGSHSVVNVINNPTAGQAIQQFVGKPLQEGIDQVRINSTSCESIAQITRDEAPYFGPIDMETACYESESQIALIIESPTFKSGNKWRFSDGESSFHAHLSDEAFLARVDQGVERFGKGDILIVKILTRQTDSFGSLKTEKIITEVVDHKTAPRQSELF